MKLDREVGSRVGAIMSMGDGKVNLFGFGTYQGDQPCPLFMDIPNPMIKLDNGKIVWGMECWWGSEEQVKQKIEGMEIIDVDIDEMRDRE